MASMAGSAASAAPPQPREWIAPEEQVKRLISPFIAKRLHSSSDEAVASVVQSSLDWLTQGSEARRGVPLPFDVSVQHLKLPPIVTDWYIALERRGALPDRVPALPPNMPQILDSKCPIWGDRRKLDGTHCKYLDTWSLSLKTPETVNELAASVKAYGEQALNDQGKRFDPDRHPFQLNYPWSASCQEHADVRSQDAPYWILHTNTIVPGSRDISYEQQVQLLGALSAKAGVQLEVPALSETVTICFDRQIARRESLYPRGSLIGDVPTYTHVRETTKGLRLIVGSFCRASGLRVGDYCGWGPQGIGVAARRTF